MTFDISQLGITAEPENIQPDEYVAPSTGEFEPLPAGTVNATLVDGKFRDTGVIQPTTVTKNGKTYLAARYAIKTDSGRFIYGFVNTIPYEQIFKEPEAGREKANAFLDLLMAAGYTGSLNNSQDYLDGLVAVVEAQAGVRAYIDWSAYCNPKSTEYAGCKTTLRGMKKFPVNSDGSYNPRVECPGNHPAGDAPTLLAQNEIKRIYPAKK